MPYIFLLKRQKTDKEYYRHTNIYIYKTRFGNAREPFNKFSILDPFLYNNHLSSKRLHLIYRCTITRVYIYIYNVYMPILLLYYIYRCFCLAT